MKNFDFINTEVNLVEYSKRLYDNEEKYPYLEKVFDSEESGYKKFKVKVFEIDYDKFNDRKK
jgi:hypothetical protein